MQKENTLVKDFVNGKDKEKVNTLINNEEVEELNKIQELKKGNENKEEKGKENKSEIKETQYYSKDDPENLMTSEMLKRVPKLYAQENVALANKEVHAAYFIPFRSNWTWYMTEYDRESGDAFGLVVGDEPEWGYFNLKDLKEQNAQRLILEDFPKTFRELKDTELKKQMNEWELQSVFDGELSFEDKAEIEAPEETEEVEEKEKEKVPESGTKK